MAPEHRQVPPSRLQPPDKPGTRNTANRSTRLRAGPRRDDSSKRTRPDSRMSRHRHSGCTIEVIGGVNPQAATIAASRCSTAIRPTSLADRVAADVRVAVTLAAVGVGMAGRYRKIIEIEIARRQHSTGARAIVAATTVATVQLDLVREAAPASSVQATWRCSSRLAAAGLIDRRAALSSHASATAAAVPLDAQA